jgi:hypothetical protein
MKFINIVFVIFVLSFLSACSGNSDFAMCEKSSVGESRMATMNKCMYDKGYKLNGAPGTSDSFSESKWEKSKNPIPKN